MIKMITRENQKCVYTQVSNMWQHLAHGIGCSLKPLRTFWSLFGSNDFNEAVRKSRKAIRLGDVSIERCRVVLRENKSAKNVGVDAVRKCYIYEPVFSSQRNRRFRSSLRQRKQSVSSASSENYSQQFWSGRHCCTSPSFL